MLRQHGHAVVESELLGSQAVLDLEERAMPVWRHRSAATGTPRRTAVASCSADL
jgi:hypothetical protein